MNARMIDMGKIQSDGVENSGAAAAINVDELKRVLPELIALAGRKQDAADMYAAGIDAAAERVGASRAALRKLVTAMHKDKTREAHEDAVEVADLIDAVSPEFDEPIRHAG